MIRCRLTPLAGQKGIFVTDLTLLELSDELIANLRVRAARHGHSVEDEAQSIRAAAVQGNELRG